MFINHNSKKGSRELIFYVRPFEKQPIILKDYYFSEHGQEIGCYESIQFIINGKELDDDEIDSFEGYSKIYIEYKSIQDFMNKNYIKLYYITQFTQYLMIQNYIFIRQLKQI